MNQDNNFDKELKNICSICYTECAFINKIEKEYRDEIKTLKSDLSSLNDKYNKLKKENYRIKELLFYKDKYLFLKNSLSSLKRKCTILEKNINNYSKLLKVEKSRISVKTNINNKKVTDKSKFSDKDILSFGEISFEYISIKSKLNRIPTFSEILEINQYGKRLFRKSLYKYYDGYKDFIIKIEGINNKKLIEDFERIKNIIGHNPTYFEIQKLSKYPIWAYNKIFHFVKKSNSTDQFSK